MPLFRIQKNMLAWFGADAVPSTTRRRPGCLAVQLERAAYRPGDRLRVRVSASTARRATLAERAQRHGTSKNLPRGSRPHTVRLPQEFNYAQSGLRGGSAAGANSSLDFALRDVVRISVQFVGKRRYLRAAKSHLPTLAGGGGARAAAAKGEFYQSPVVEIYSREDERAAQAAAKVSARAARRAGGSESQASANEDDSGDSIASEADHGMLSDRSCVACIRLPATLPPSYRGEYACVNYFLKLSVEVADGGAVAAQIRGHDNAGTRVVLLKLPLVLRGTCSDGNHSDSASSDDAQQVASCLPVRVTLQPRGFLFCRASPSSSSVPSTLSSSSASHTLDSEAARSGIPPLATGNNSNGATTVSFSHLRACSNEDDVSSRSLDHGASPARAGSAGAAIPLSLQRLAPTMTFRVRASSATGPDPDQHVATVRLYNFSPRASESITVHMNFEEGRAETRDDVNMGPRSPAPRCVYVCAALVRSETLNVAATMEGADTQYNNNADNERMKWTTVSTFRESVRGAYSSWCALPVPEDALSMADGRVAMSWKIKFAFRVVVASAAGGAGNEGHRGKEEDAHVYSCEYPVHVQSEWRAGREREEEEGPTARRADFCGALRWGLTYA